MNNKKSNESNESNASNESNDKTCIICLENNNEVLIEYNHCGKYYIHNKCLNEWDNLNECIICRSNLIDIEQESNRDSMSENNIVTLIIEPSNNIESSDDHTRLKKCFLTFLSFSFFSFSLYIIFEYVIYD